MSMVNIEGLSKAAVLAALYNRSYPQGMGVLAASAGEMTVPEAADILAIATCFDYLHGRVMKIDLESDVEFDPYLYDRDLGQGAAQAVIDNLRGAK